MKKVALIALFALAISVLAACGGGTASTTASPTNTPTASSSNNANTVTLGANTFSTSSITITKGSTIIFTNSPSSGTEHILVIGTQGAPATEDGAPDFGGTNGTTIMAGASFTTGAWNTDGTYHVTCTIHPTTMNLTVTVTG